MIRIIFLIITLAFSIQAQNLKLEILNGHSGGGVLAVAVSTDGKFALTASTDQTALLWDLETGKQLRRFVGHEDAVSAVQFSRDGSLVLTAGYDGAAYLWRTATGERVRGFSENRNGMLVKHTGKILSAAISSDGRFVATAGEDRTARIWDLSSGKQLFELKHAGRVNSIAFSPDSRFLLTGGEDKIARLYSTANGKEEKQFVGHTGEIMSVGYSPDGKGILTGSKDSTARLWNVETKFDYKRFSPGTGVDGVAFTSNGKNIITLGDHQRTGIRLMAEPKPTEEEMADPNYINPGGFNIWDVNEGKSIYKSSEQFSSLALIPDKDQILLSKKKSNKISVFNLTKFSFLEELSGKSDVVNNVSLPTDFRFVMAGGNNHTSGLWNLESGGMDQWWTKIEKDTPGSVNHYFSSFSIDGKLYATNYGSDVLILSVEKSEPSQLIQIRDDGEVSQTRVSFPIIFSPSGLQIYSTREFNGLLWDIRRVDYLEERSKIPVTKNYLIRFTGHQDQINGADFSPDGKTIATASDDKTVRLWNAETGEVKLIIKDFLTPVWSVAFSPDGKTLATASGGEVEPLQVGIGNAAKANSVQFWDVETGREIGRFGGDLKIINNKIPGFKSVAFSPDGKFTAAGSLDDEVYLLNNETGRVRQFEGHTDTVNSVKFAKDANGKLLVVSGSSDSTTRIWDAATGEEICALVTFRDGNWAVVQTKTGRYDAPNGGEIEGIQWVFGNETIALNQLKDIYYTPNLLPRLLGYMPNQPLADVRSLLEIKLFPEVIEQNFDENSSNLTFKIKNRGGGIGAVRLMINGSLAAEDARSEDLKKQLKTNPNLTETVVTFNVKQSAGFNPKGENCIDIITSDFDQNAQKSFVNSNPKCGGNPKTSAKGTAVFNLGGNDNLPEPTLYAIVAGVSDYNGDQLDLNYAAKDAEDFANALGIGARNFLCKKDVPQCDKVNIKLLTTPPKGETKNPFELPTKPNIKAAFAEFAQKAKPEDILVVYFSGHGTSLNVGEQETYFYLTQESENGSPSSVRNTPERSISNTEILHWLSQEFWRTDKKGIDAKNKVMILDTCAAGAFEKVLERNLSPDQIRALEKLKDRSGLQILMGSAANQSAYEASQYGQGLLTYALLEGMKGAALKNETSVETGTLFDYAVNRVPKMDISNGTSGLQSPRIFGSTSIPIGLILSKADKDEIKIQESPLPIFGRPFFVKKGESDDTLFLIDTFAKKLDEAAETVSRGANGNRQTAPIVFIDKNNFPGAFRVTGTYTEENSLIFIEEIKIKKGEMLITIEGKVSGKTAEEVADNLLKEILKNLTKFTK